MPSLSQPYLVEAEGKGEMNHPEEIKDLLDICEVDSRMGYASDHSDLVIEAFRRGQIAQDKVWKDAVDKWVAGK